LTSQSDLLLPFPRYVNNASNEHYCCEPMQHGADIVTQLVKCEVMRNQSVVCGGNAGKTVQ